jgi:hypothetical protein
VCPYLDKYKLYFITGFIILKPLRPRRWSLSVPHTQGMCIPFACILSISNRALPHQAEGYNGNSVLLCHSTSEYVIGQARSLLSL